MERIFLKSGDRYLQVKVGWSLDGASGRVKLKEVGKEVATRRPSSIFDLSVLIMPGIWKFEDRSGNLAPGTVLQQGKTEAFIATRHCDARSLYKNACNLLGLQT